MRWLSIVVMLCACGEVRQVNRWPNHRREKDAEIERLGEQARIVEMRIKKLEDELAKLQRAPASPP